MTNSIIAANETKFINYHTPVFGLFCDFIVG